MSKALLALEDGSVFAGRAFGVAQAVTSAGEVVFNTAMCGYQEALTDPSYAGQILVMTAPMIGNYGVARDDVESDRPQVAGFVVRELARRHSNHRAERDLASWLGAFGVLGIEGVDTRSLVRRIREAGALRGVISSEPQATPEGLVRFARAAEPMAGRNLAAEVSPSSPGTWTEGLGSWDRGVERSTDRRYRVVALDCGAKRTIYRHLAERGCDVEILPHDATAREIRERRPDGLFISNGPGDPAAVSATIATLREVAGEIPTFGICLGHQLLALALGARTYKLKFGHRGANQPVRNALTGRVEITSQNHGFCVDPESLREAGCETTHVHLNDGTLAGFRHATLPIFAVQFHPESSPGPHDSAELFDRFIEMMATRSPLAAASEH
jgi:carbamoyl-phosphate synthase small subunit